MNLQQLAIHDGREGRKAYIAVNGTVYDVTDSPRWKNGLHPPNHQAGQELSEELNAAPHVRAVIERFPVVGTLEEEAPQKTSGSKLTVGLVLCAAIAALVFFLLL